MNIQYKKGVLELCVMAMLSVSDRYGYEISEFLSEKIDVSDGTVYPILRKLKSDGLVAAYISEDSGGPPRKYYSLTRTGREEFDRAKTEWFAFSDAVGRIIEGE